jgi:predicted dehydrogenase
MIVAHLERTQFLAVGRAMRKNSTLRFPDSLMTRRNALRLSAGSILLAQGISPSNAQTGGAPIDRGGIKDGEPRFGPIAKPNEAATKPVDGPLAPASRVGFAIVALGRLSVEEILPAFAQTKKCKLSALVSGSPGKLEVLGSQYGLPKSSLYSYDNLERLKENEEVRVVYIVLPNSLHKKFVLRTAAIKKHILCEKPMATTSADAQSMVDACAAASVKLMIAYRCRYQPHHLEIIKRAQSGAFGPVRLIEAINAQNQGDPDQWRLRKAIAGGGSLPDVGIYCLNAARAVTGEEPIEIEAQLSSPPNDPRFREVEETVSWLMRFPSGALASLSASYGVHRASRLAVHMDAGSLVLDHAFPYNGQKLSMTKAEDGVDTETQLEIAHKDHFALEMDHMADCVLNDTSPKTPGEEGVRDIRLMETIYRAAETRSPIRL